MKMYFAPVLSGGPYHLHIVGIAYGEAIDCEMEPTLDLNGKPSICAPVIYQRRPGLKHHYQATGYRNLVKSMIFKYEGVLQG